MGDTVSSSIEYLHWNTCQSDYIYLFHIKLWVYKNFAPHPRAQLGLEVDELWFNLKKKLKTKLTGAEYDGMMIRDEAKMIIYDSYEMIWDSYMMTLLMRWSWMRGWLPVPFPVLWNYWKNVLRLNLNYSIN